MKLWSRYPFKKTSMNPTPFLNFVSMCVQVHKKHLHEFFISKILMFIFYFVWSCFYSKPHGTPTGNHWCWCHPLICKFPFGPNKVTCNTFKHHTSLPSMTHAGTNLFNPYCISLPNVCSSCPGPLHIDLSFLAPKSHLYLAWKQWLLFFMAANKILVNHKTILTQKSSFIMSQRFISTLLVCLKLK
jgi:hypothetical protein